MNETTEYKGREWPSHVRKFYYEWLRATGLQANNQQALDRFISRMEEMFGDYLMDSRLDFNAIGLSRIEEENE